MAAYEPDAEGCRKLLVASLADDGSLNAVRADMRGRGGGEETVVMSMSRSASVVDRGGGKGGGGGKGEKGEKGERGGKGGSSKPLGSGRDAASRKEQGGWKEQWVDEAVVHRADYNDTEGNCPAYILVVDDKRRDICVALRGLHLARASDYLIPLRNRKGKQVMCVREGE